MSNTQSLTPWGDCILCEKHKLWNTMGKCHQAETMMWEHRCRNRNCSGAEGRGWSGRIHNIAIPAPWPPTHVLPLKDDICESEACPSHSSVSHPRSWVCNRSVSLHAAQRPQPPSPAVSGHLLCATHRSEHFLSSNWFNPHNNITRLVLSLSVVQMKKLRHRKIFFFERCPRCRAWKR